MDSLKILNLNTTWKTFIMEGYMTFNLNRTWKISGLILISLKFSNYNMISFKLVICISYLGILGVWLFHD